MQLHELNDIIAGFAKNFDSMLKKTNTYDPADLRAVLRSYIDRLEQLYRGI